MTICVDGATNQFYDLLHRRSRPKRKKSAGSGLIPDVISGDFDSVDPNLLTYFNDLGSKIVKTPDQNNTDFAKALLLLSDHLSTSKMKVRSRILA